MIQRKVYLTIFLVSTFIFSASLSVSGQMTTQERNNLIAFSEQKRIEFDSSFSALQVKAEQLNIPMTILNANGYVYGFLKEIHPSGTPEYIYLRNTISQQTISANQVKSGGIAGYNLSGSGERLGIWDGNVRVAHQEFGGRASYGDGAGTLDDHGTHVAGTIAAAGVDANAQGMSHAVTLFCYNPSNDISEMAAAAAMTPPISASNHSYGPDYGWAWNPGAGMWSWWGNSSATEDWRHGAYLDEARNYDQTAKNAPYYTIVVAAGNENGSGTTGTHQHGGSGNFNDTHQLDGGGVSVDCLPNDATAKNVITVGNAQAIAGGYSNPTQVVLAGSSSVGPTDDGRIKPDIVAQGVGVYSCEELSNTDYGTKSGTSMAAPAVTGSIGLLAEHWRNLNSPSAVLKSATYKALLIHSADEAGPNPGPDYQFGWGLVNVRRAAQIMEADAYQGCKHVFENSINTGETYTFTFETNGLEPITATIAWTDKEGPKSSSGVIDESTSRLVNDLDLRISAGGNTWFPYTLDPASPFAAASTGDNNRDNVEQVFIELVWPGTYTVSVTPKGNIDSGPQDFSMILSGNGPLAVNQNITFSTFIEPTTYVASNSITMSNTASVGSGGNLQLFAGSYIDLLPDFQTSGNGELTAQIIPAPCGSGSLVSGNETVIEIK
jgi:subtilisin family serine protease